MLRHIGIQINDKNEIEDFYNEILGFKELNRFDLDNQAAKMFLANAIQLK